MSADEVSALEDLVEYAELHCLSNYSFLKGASFPEELVAEAARLGYGAIAVTDECSLAGVVRAHVAAKVHNITLLIGSEFILDTGCRLVILACNRQAYGDLAQLISYARRDCKKGEYRLTLSQLQQQLAQLQHLRCDTFVLWIAPQGLTADSLDTQCEILQQLKSSLRERLYIGVSLLLLGDEQKRLSLLQQLSVRTGLPMSAVGAVLMHQRQRQDVQDVLSAIASGKAVKDMGYDLHANAERYLRPLSKLQRLYPRDLLQQTMVIARQCRFSLDELRYEYPAELVPEGYSASAWLRRLCLQGMAGRWPQGVPFKVRRLLVHELALIRELRYEPYFLTVHDVVAYARARGILCQGRGSAANSAVCYCLGITEVDPGRMQLLFERFISRERDEPPDIDVDFEHERREEVIQYIYNKYGRERAALAATVITYQARSAIRDVGKALGLSVDQVDRLAKSHYWWDQPQTLPEQLKQQGFDLDCNPLLQHLLRLVSIIIGFPRHLSQHVGGFVISRGLLTRLVPVENAAMPGRTVIQWEKNDLEALGLLKVDVLALGMLSAMRKALSYISDYTKTSWRLADIPAEDPAVYAMIQKADTIGVFQIESRAQMSMLPRLKPANFYDLVIEIAIVRPGPIQGEMVHPYLARRNGQTPVTYPSEVVEKVLSRTLGVPIFQEQVMQLAIVAAGFSAGEADQLRRSMAAWRRRGGLEAFEQKLMQGMQQRGYSEGFARQIFNQIKGFGDYGFPESHSASFALLAYASSWLKCYHPAAFTCALLNSQPMGFYAPSQLVQDAQRHGVCVLPVDVNASDYDCTLEADNRGIPDSESKQILRLGLRMVKGLSQQMARTIVAYRQRVQGFVNVQQLATVTRINKKDLQSLAAAGALRSLSTDRHRAYWEVSAVEQVLPLFADRVEQAGESITDVMLPRSTEGQNIVADYASLGLSLERHPLALLRGRLQTKGIITAQQLYGRRNNSYVRTAGLVIGRQRPGTASGVVFVTLEDESGYANVVVWPQVAQQQRKVLLKARLMAVAGVVQQQDGVLHVIASKLLDLSHWLGALNARSRDFC